MAGGSQTYNYGLMRRKHDHHGCPNDLLNSRQLIKAGWSWASYISSQPRFTGKVGTTRIASALGAVLGTDTTKTGASQATATTMVAHGQLSQAFFLHVREREGPST